MKSNRDQHLSRLITSVALISIVLGFYKSIFINAIPVDLTDYSSERNKNSSPSSNISDEIFDEGINYRLNTWSRYDNPEEGIQREGDIHESPEFRTFTRNQNLLWPKGVVKYWLHPSIRNATEKLAILKEAMNIIMEKTCVVFKEIFPDENGKFPPLFWVNITGNQRGCFSDLGRSQHKPGNLNLEVANCFGKKGHAIHEILHILGVYHEHMRPDRDEYIKIMWDNIKEEDTDNFFMMPNSKVTTYGLPYDYDSIMHYSMTAFAKNKSRASIVPKERGTNIGQRDHLSVYDIKKLLIAYKCYDTDSSVIENATNSINNIEHQEKEFMNSTTELDVQKNNCHNYVNSSESFFSRELFQSWSFVGLFHYACHVAFSLFIGCCN